jgi:amidohydrolase
MISLNLSDIRRHLHQFPEVGFEEWETAAFIRQQLQNLGLNYTVAAKTGTFIDIVGNSSGRKIAYRADIDALPIQDGKSVDYASKIPQKAHLCGHDVHTTVALGIVENLLARKSEINGTIRVFFQPNEEGTPSGAPLMLADGVLGGCEEVYAIHVDPTLSVGKFAVRIGAVTAATDSFELHISGAKTGHSARPHEVIDTVWVLHQIMNQWYQLATRVQDSRDPAVITICKLLAGGEALNVIPKTATCGGTLRTTHPDDRIKLQGLFAEIAHQTAKIYGATATLNFLKGAPAVRNSENLHGNVVQTITRLFGEEALFHTPRPSMGGEDFAHYLSVCDGYFVRLGTCSSPETAYPVHDARFDIDERAMPLAVQLMSEVLLGSLRGQ